MITGWLSRELGDKNELVSFGDVYGWIYSEGLGLFVAVSLGATRPVVISKRVWCEGEKSTCFHLISPSDCIDRSSNEQSDNLVKEAFLLLTNRVSVISHAKFGCHVL